MSKQSDKYNETTPAGGSLREEAKKDEMKTEQSKDSHLKTGEERVIERAVAANGEGPEAE